MKADIVFNWVGRTEGGTKSSVSEHILKVSRDNFQVLLMENLGKNEELFYVLRAKQNHK